MGKGVRRAARAAVVGGLAWVWLAGVGLAGQFPEDPKPVHLNAAAEAKLGELGELGELPAAKWRVLEGDLAHGEAVGLEDSGWAEREAPWVGSGGTVWFRRRITVPKRLDGYALAGAKIWFEFDVWDEGPVPLIVYFDGRRVAMGESLEPIVLWEHAEPGETVEVAVKALESADAKHFAGAHLRIEAAAGRPNPQRVRDEALSAEELIPALTVEGAKRSQALGELQAAVDAIDVRALQAGDQAGFDASLERAQRRMEELRPLLAEVRYHLTGDAHIDAAWVWPWTETVDVVHRTFGTALQLMREYPKYTFTQPAAAYYDWMAEKYPPLNREIGERVKEGRWEVVGGMWVEPDLNLPDGESLVRQLLLGTRFFAQQYGVGVRVGWNVDSFGYNWQLPQIYKRSGIDYFVTQKMDWNETNRLPLKLFYWQSPDGSRVLTYFPHNYTNFIEPVRMAEDFNVARRENPGLPVMMHLYGIGDHGGGPTRSMLDAAESWMGEENVFPAARYGSAEAYFHAVEPRLDVTQAPVWNYAALAAGKGKLPRPAEGRIAVPVWNDELYLEYTRGAYTSQAEEKRNLRRSEVEMLKAEEWSAMAWQQQPRVGHPGSELNEAWKKVLFNQFHDIAAGSSAGVVYADAERDYEQVSRMSGEIERRARGELADAIDTRPPAGEGWAPVVVWNPLGWPRSEVVPVDVELPSGAARVEVVDGAGRAVLSQAAEVQPAGARHRVEFLASEVPALGYRVYFARAAGPERERESGVKVEREGDEIVLENGVLRVSVDARTGCLTHLISLRDGFDSIAAGGCGGELQSFEDRPAAYDAWNLDASALDHPRPLPRPRAVEVMESGPLLGRVRLAYAWSASSVEQRVSLAAGEDLVRIENTVQWHERHTLLKAAFPLAASSAEASFEIPYGSIERPTTRNNSWEAAKFEVPALRWADEGDGRHGLSVLNDSKYGYDAKGGVLRLSLLRSPTSPDPEADQGEQRFAYALYPHAGGWKQAETMRRGYEFNTPLEAEQVEVHPGRPGAARSFIGLTPATLTLTAVKKTEDGDGLLLRFYEWAGGSGTATLHVPSGVRRAELTNLMEKAEPGQLRLGSDTVEVPYTPYSIVTVRVEYGGRP